MAKEHLKEYIRFLKDNDCFLSVFQSVRSAINNAAARAELFPQWYKDKIHRFNIEAFLKEYEHYIPASYPIYISGNRLPILVRKKWENYCEVKGGDYEYPWNNYMFMSNYNLTDLLNSAFSAEPQRHEPQINDEIGDRIERPIRRPRRINAEQREQERLRRNYYNRNQHFRLR